MLKRFEPALKLVCLVLGVLVVYQVLRLFAQKDSLQDLEMSVTPVLSTASTASAPATIKKETNPPSSLQTSLPPSTNILGTARPTNGAAVVGMANSNLTTTAVVAAARSPSRISPGRGQPQPDLPAAIQARIDRIVQSEILGPVIRPLPMALLGIGGKDAFIRAPNGQIGLLREGEELGGLKLLRIGTNRVLVEHEQQQSELSIFAGFGSEPLIGKEK